MNPQYLSALAKLLKLDGVRFSLKFNQSSQIDTDLEFKVRQIFDQDQSIAQQLATTVAKLKYIQTNWDTIQQQAPPGPGPGPAPAPGPVPDKTAFLAQSNLILATFSQLSDLRNKNLQPLTREQLTTVQDQFDVIDQSLRDVFNNDDNFNNQDYDQLFNEQMQEINDRRFEREFQRIQEQPFLIQLIDGQWKKFGIISSENKPRFFDMRDRDVVSILDAQPTSDQIDEDVMIHYHDQIYKYYSGSQETTQISSETPMITNMFIYINNKERGDKIFSYEVQDIELIKYRQNAGLTYTFMMMSSEHTLIFMTSTKKIKLNLRGMKQLKTDKIIRVDNVINLQKGAHILIVSEKFESLKENAFFKQVQNHSAILEQLLKLVKDCVVNGIYFQKFFGLEFLNEILCVDSKNVIRISPLLFLYSSDNAETDDGGVDEMKEIEAATEKPLVTTIEQLRKIQLGYSTIMNDQGHVIFLSMQKMPDHFVYSLHRILSYFLGVVFGNLIIPTVEDSNIYKKNVTVEEGYGVIFQSADAQDVQNFGKCFDLYNIYVSTYARTHTSITNESQTMMKKILHMIFMVLQIPDPKFNYYQVHDATNPREKLELEIYKAELKERKQEFIDYFLLSELQKHSRAGRFTI